MASTTLPSQPFLSSQKSSSNKFLPPSQCPLSNSIVVRFAPSSPKKKRKKKENVFSRKWPPVSGVENLPWKVHGGEEIPPVNRKQGRERREGEDRRETEDRRTGTRGGWLSSPWKEKSGLRRLVKEQLPYSWATKQRAKARGEREREGVGKEKWKRRWFLESWKLREVTPTLPGYVHN